MELNHLHVCVCVCVCVQGADINARDHCGWIPLHEACNHGHTG